MHTTLRFLILLRPQSCREHRTIKEMTKIVNNYSEGTREVDAQNQRMNFIVETIRMTRTVIEDSNSGFPMYGRKGQSRDRL